MFSKSKINDPIDTREVESSASAVLPVKRQQASLPSNSFGAPAPAAPRAAPDMGKPAPSIISPDMTITGNLVTTGDMQVEGVIEGDIRSNLLTIGQNATIRGEVVADDIIVNGRVIGRIRGLKVRLSSTAQVEGDVLHKTIAIEAGAHFEGSVQRSDDPLADSGSLKSISGASSKIFGAEDDGVDEL